MKTLNPYVCTSNGREYKYQVMPLSEDRKPAKYIDGISPIDCYALVDVENDVIVSEILEDISLADAENILLKNYEYEN